LKNEILVFGGSFDPFHNSHKHMIEHFSNPVIIIPTYNPYKNNFLLTLEQRINSIKKVKFKNGSSVESFTKTNQDYYMYMVNVIKEIEKKNPNKKINLIMGSDTFNKMSEWKNIDYIHSVINKFYIFVRENETVLNKKLNISIIKNVLENEYSSTEIRSLLKNKNIKELKKQVPIEIFNFLLDL
jgi:nicotinate-nucleotide adenylyltransferase